MIAERIISKVTSGQWILTVACAVTFCWLSIAGTLPSEAVTAILGSVFTAYFNRRRTADSEDQTESGETQKGTGTEDYGRRPS